MTQVATVIQPVDVPITLRKPWIAIVANPFSGAGANRQAVLRLVTAIRRQGMYCRVLWDPLERAAVLRDPDWAASCRCVIAAGGDGTVADVVNETRDIPLAMMPIGNENLFAREFGFRRPDQIAAAVARGRTRNIDLGQANGRWFTLMVAAGLDADVVHRVAQWRVRADHLRRVTRLSYVLPIMRAMGGYRYPLIELIADGRTVRGAMAMVFNVCQYACRLRFTPQARAEDGLLHWIVFEKPGRLAALNYAMSVALGRHLRRADVRHGSATHIQLRAETDVPVQVDGDPSGHLPMDVRAIAGAMKIIDTRP